MKKGVSFDLSDKELFCIEEQEIFDRVYSLVKGFASLTPPCKLNLVETLRSNLSVLLPNVDLLSRNSLSRGDKSDNGSDDGESGGEADGENGDANFGDRMASHRNAFKIYTFFLVHIVLIEEASSASAANTTTRVIQTFLRFLHSPSMSIIYIHVCVCMHMLYLLLLIATNYLLCLIISGWSLSDYCHNGLLAD